MYGEIKNTGAEIVAISPQLQKYSRQISSKHGIEFGVLSDPGNLTAEAFGLTYKLPDYLIGVYKDFEIDLERFNGDDSWKLPMPATYIAGRDGRLMYSEYDPDYTRRPEPSEIVEFLKSIA